jgi:hypothetical protein
MIEICHKITYDEKEEEIIVKIDDKEKHNMKFKLDLRTKTYDLNKLIFFNDILPFRNVGFY